MLEVFVERAFEAPVDAARLGHEAEAARAVFDRCGIAWRGALLASNGRRALCRLSAPDLAAVRHAFRLLALPVRGLWAGKPEAALRGHANVAVERFRVLSGPAVPAPDWCLTAHRVRFAGALVSADRQRVLELFDAPDAESVRRARGADAGNGDRVWAFELLPGLQDAAQRAKIGR